MLFLLSCALYYNNVSFLDDTAGKDAGKNPLMRHNACADALADGACLVAFLADLRYLQHHITALQNGTHGKGCTVDAVYKQVFPKSAVTDTGPQQVELLYLLIAEQTDLAMPVAGMRIPVYSPVRPEDCGMDISFLCSLFRTCADGFNDSLYHRMAPFFFLSVFWCDGSVRLFHEADSFGMCREAMC